jgi:hypothetical protein
MIRRFWAVPDKSLLTVSVLVLDLHVTCPLAVANVMSFVRTIHQKLSNPG